MTEQAIEQAAGQDKPGRDFPELLVATTPAAMVQAQQSMIALCDKRITEHQAALNELNAEMEHAKRQAWKTTHYVKFIKREEKVVTYYQKIKQALELGYCIIPDLPLEIFAIRTTRQQPRPDFYNSTSGDRHREIPAEITEAGKGRYVDPEPLVDSSYAGTKKDGDKERTVTKYYNAGFDDVSFPMVGVKPIILEATQEAMRHMLFDEIGALPGSPQKIQARGRATAAPGRIKDPIVVGRIIDPRSPASAWWQHNRNGVRNGLSFLVAWWFRPEDL